MSAEEDLLIKKLDYKKIEAQLERRILRAPIDGVIAKIQKEEGEYVAPHDPYVLTLVQLDPLLATFPLSNSQTAQLTIGTKVLLRPMDAGDPQKGESVLMEGRVDFIAPVTDAESGTVRVKVRTDNRGGKYRSGERCSWELPAQSQLAARCVNRATETKRTRTTSRRKDPVWSSSGGILE